MCFTCFKDRSKENCLYTFILENLEIYKALVDTVQLNSYI